MKKLLSILLFLPSLCWGQFHSNQQPEIGDRVPAVDVTTNAQISITYEHHEVHAGSHYTFNAHDADADVNDTVGVILVTPNTTKWAHMVVNISGALQTEVSIFETTTRGTGAVLADYNNNRNVSDTSSVIIYAIANGGANGTLIFQDHFGIDAGIGINNTSGGGASRGAREWILKQNTSYMITAASLTADNVISMVLSWYEHTNK